MKNKDLYLKEVRARLLCARSEKNAILQELEADVGEYLEDHPDATVSDLKKRFGVPEEIAASANYTMNQNELRQQMDQKRKMVAICAAVGIVILICAGFYYNKMMADVPEYYVTEERICQSVPEDEQITSDTPNTAWA